MIKTIKYLLLFSPVLFASFECSDSVTNPPNYPPGYQYDIPWPSLADSPWPMYQNNPQSNGRSKYIGPQNGLITDKIVAYRMQSSIIVGDSAIYFCAFDSLKAVSLSNKLLWGCSLFDAYTTPVLSSKGILYFADSQKNLVAVDHSGNIRWRYNTSWRTVGQGSITIGLNGIIYFLDSGSNLFAIKENGELFWRKFDSRFDCNESSALTFSPDGRTLYIPGIEVSVLAVDITNQEIKWTFGSIRNRSTNLVDAQGNIYLVTKQQGDTTHYMYSIKPSGEVRWKYLVGGSTFYGNAGAMDREGNIYFEANNILWSLDYAGNLRWSKTDGPGGPIVVDALGNIYAGYFGPYGTNDFFVKCYNKNGSEIWKLNIVEGRQPGGGPAISSNGLLYFPPFRTNNLLIIK